MRRYKVQVRCEKLVRTVDTFYVDAWDDRGAKQEALEAAEAAYPEYDNALLIGRPEVLEDGDDE